MSFMQEHMDCAAHKTLMRQNIMTTNGKQREEIRSVCSSRHQVQGGELNRITLQLQPNSELVVIKMFSALFIIEPNEEPPWHNFSQAGVQLLNTRCSPELNYDGGQAKFLFPWLLYVYCNFSPERWVISSLFILNYATFKNMLTLFTADAWLPLGRVSFPDACIREQPAPWELHNAM